MKATEIKPHHLLRPVGSTPNYQTHNWSVNLYDAPGTVYFEYNKLTLDVEPQSCLLMMPFVQRRFDFQAPCNHRVMHFQWPKTRALAPPGYRFVRLSTPVWENALHYFDKLNRHYATQPQRSEAFAQVLLWELSQDLDLEDTQAHTHPALELAIAFIEANVNQPIKAADIVNASEISQNQLIRLFQKHHQTTIVGWLKERRMQRAKDLLCDSNLPIKIVASDVGLPDLQQFNKAVRSAFGVSPRALRSAKPLS